MKKATVKSTYHRHFRDTAEGHIFIDKEGACTIELTGAAAMSQKELDFYGEVIAKAISKITVDQIKQFK